MKNLFVFGILFWSTAAVAADPAAPAPIPPPEESRRELAGHIFLPSQVVFDPFVTTHIGESTGFGYAAFRLGTTDNGQKTNHDLQFAFLQQTFDFQVAPMKWWAVHVQLGGTVQSGIDADSALIRGAEVGYVVGAGAIFSWKLGRVRLGAGFDFNYSPFYGLSPLTALQASAAAGKVDTTTLFTSADNLNLRPSLLMAIGLHRALGLRLTIDYDHLFSGSALPDTDELNFGGLMDIDLHQVSKAPVGILLGYKIGVIVSGAVAGDNGIEHALTAGIFYTGRRNLALGLEALLFFPRFETNQTDYLRVSATFDLRYYWN